MAGQIRQREGPKDKEDVLRPDNRDASADLKYRDQLRTAAASAAMNIAEGFYRYNARDFARHLSIAMASLGEAALWLKDGVDRGYFTPGACDEAVARLSRDVRTSGPRT